MSKRIIASLLLSLGALSLNAQKISIFCDHIESIAQQQNVSFAKAAEMVWETGYRGADVWVNQNSAHIKTLDSLGFRFTCAIAYLDFYESDRKKEIRQAFKFMSDNGIDKLMVVPGLDKDKSGKDVTKNIAALSRKASEKGFTVMVEDYGNMDSPCRTTADIERLLTAIPSLGHTFDSGNYLFSSEDCIKALNKFSDRVRHVHLKDHVSQQNLKEQPVGTGCIPVCYVIRSLLANGYDGWFTVEHFGAEDMLSYARTSFQNVNKALNLGKMNPKMTEYYYPEVPVVQPVPTDTAAPQGATVLFDGSSLAKWEGRKGSRAEWTINPDGSVTVDKSKGDIRTRESLSGNYHLHLEWKVPVEIQGSGQARGNSGVFLNGTYEVQILDSWENKTYVNGQAASIYKQWAPSANPIRRPGEWNVYDIFFTSPVLREDGSLLSRPRVTVVFNGVTVQDDVEILGSTEYIGLPKPKWSTSGQISLQSHGDKSIPVSFRNIWYKPL